MDQTAPQATPDSSIIPDNLLVIQCAWCLQEAGLPMGPGTHGICAKHAKQVYDNWKQGKEEERTLHA